MVLTHSAWFCQSCRCVSEFLTHSFVSGQDGRGMRRAARDDRPGRASEQHSPSMSVSPHGGRPRHYPGSPARGITSPSCGHNSCGAAVLAAHERRNTCVWACAPRRPGTAIGRRRAGAQPCQWVAAAAQFARAGSLVAVEPPKGQEGLWGGHARMLPHDSRILNSLYLPRA